MNIESGEILWIKSLSNEQINKFEQIVIEFHSPFSNNEIEVFDKLNKNHYLIHFMEIIIVVLDIIKMY
jgi:hypothetical protein